MMDLAAAKESHENVSTSREMMNLLGVIYRGKVVNHESTADFFKVPSTNKDSWIPRDLPTDLKVANKPGSLEAVRNDSGVVFVEGRPYVICVMTSFLGSEREGEEAISTFLSPHGACSTVSVGPPNMGGLFRLATALAETSSSSRRE